MKVQLLTKQALVDQLGHNVVRCRTRAELTQEMAAEQAVIARTHLSMLERGKRDAQLETIVRLAGAFGVNPGELLLGIAWRPTTSQLPGGFYVPDSTEEDQALR